ncbi:LCP family protein [Cyanobium sp. FGCU-52]|nr:LCP family protein [Cyanobium sp. FGCU52]
MPRKRSKQEPQAGQGQKPRLRLRLPSLRDPRFRHDLGLLAVGIGGALAGGSLFGWIWPEPDRSLATQLEVTPGSLAEKPGRPVTVLVIGSDADALGASDNGAAPRGPARSDTLLLVRVNPKGPLQVLQLPVELAVNLPGSAQPVRLGDLYSRGGPMLTADVVRELVGLEPGRPDRYLVLPRGALRNLVSEVGGLEVSPPTTMKYEDKSRQYRIDLQSGLQRLDGRQVEQLVRYRDKWLGEQSRRTNQKLVVSSLRERLEQPEVLARLPALLAGLQGQVETNLTARESLSLLAAGLDDDRPIQFAVLPLDPQKKEHGGLRQLAADATGPLWKAP